MELLVVNPVKDSLDDVVMFCINPTYYAEAEIRRGERRKKTPGGVSAPCDLGKSPSHQTNSSNNAVLLFATV